MEELKTHNNFWGTRKFLNILFNHHLYNEASLSLVAIVVIRIKTKNIFSNLQWLIWSFDLLCSLIHKYTKSFETTCTKSLRHLYSSPLVGVENIPSPLFLFLEVEQRYIEQFDATIFQNKLKFKISTKKWFVYSGSLCEFPDYSFLLTMSGKNSWLQLCKCILTV